MSSLVDKKFERNEESGRGLRLYRARISEENYEMFQDNLPPG
jgi:hypothetical protein